MWTFTTEFLPALPLARLPSADLTHQSDRGQSQWEMQVVFCSISDMNGWWEDCLNSFENCRLWSSVPKKQEEIVCWGSGISFIPIPTLLYVSLVRNCILWPMPFSFGFCVPTLKISTAGVLYNPRLVLRIWNPVAECPLVHTPIQVDILQYKPLKNGLLKSNQNLQIVW